jgi:hypothetical protein
VAIGVKLPEGESKESFADAIMGMALGFTPVSGFKNMIKSLEGKGGLGRSLVEGEKFNPLVLLRSLVDRFKPGAYESTYGPWAGDAYQSLSGWPANHVYFPKNIIGRQLTKFDNFAMGHELGHNIGSNIPIEKYNETINAIKSLGKGNLTKDVDELLSIVNPGKGQLIDRPNYWHYGAPQQRPFSELISDFFGAVNVGANPEKILKNALPNKEFLLEYLR